MRRRAVLTVLLAAAVAMPARATVGLISIVNKGIPEPPPGYAVLIDPLANVLSDPLGNTYLDLAP